MSTRHAFSTPPSPRQGCLATPSRAFPSSSRRYNSRPRRSSTSCPGMMHHPPLPLGPGLSLPVAVGALLRPPELLRPRPNLHLGRRLSQESEERSRREVDEVQEVDEAALTRATRRCWKLLFLRRRREQHRSFPRWRAGRRIFRLILFLFRRWSKGCPACLAGSRGQFDSATRFSSPGDLPSSTAFSRRRWQSGTPCLARGDCCPPGKGCNRAGPSSRDEAGVLQPLLHRTQERWWPSANPGSASLEPGFTQAPVQDADAQAHDQMHSAPELVCSYRPDGRLLSRFDPSTTQTVSTVCIRRTGMAVQGPPLWDLPVSPCVHEGRRRRPYPVMGGGRQDPQLPRRLTYPSPIQRAVGRSQGLGASSPQPVGASGQLGKDQALPCAENLFSRCGVRLGEYDGTPHGGTSPSSAELPEFIQRQECGTTETVSEAPGAYGVRSCSHAARIASYETTSALATLPGPEVGMAPRYTASGYHPAVSPLPQPLDGPCLSTGRPAPRTSVPAYCCHNRCLQHGLGRYMQRAGSLGALDRAPTALAHQLPRAVGSAFSLTAVPATAVGQARASTHGQHCGGLVHQPAGIYTITPHVTARPPSLPLESHAVQVTAHCSHPVEAQSCGRHALQECCLLPCVGARRLFGRHLQSCRLGDTEHIRKILQSPR